MCRLIPHFRDDAVTDRRLKSDHIDLFDEVTITFKQRLHKFMTALNETVINHADLYRPTASQQRRIIMTKLTLSLRGVTFKVIQGQVKGSVKGRIYVTLSHL